MSEVEGGEVLQVGDEVEFVVVTNQRTRKHSACCVRKLWWGFILKYLAFKEIPYFYFFAQHQKKFKLKILTKKIIGLATPSGRRDSSPSWRRWTSRRRRAGRPGWWWSGSPRARTAPRGSPPGATRRRAPWWWWTSWSSSPRTEGDQEIFLGEFKKRYDILSWNLSGFLLRLLEFVTKL